MDTATPALAFVALELVADALADVDELAAAAVLACFDPELAPEFRLVDKLLMVMGQMQQLSCLSRTAHCGVAVWRTAAKKTTFYLLIDDTKINLMATK